MEGSRKYDDIIHLSRPISGRHGRMSMVARGAQFSPFAALTGYDGVLQESARLTETDCELAEDGYIQLNESLHRIEAQLPEQPEVEIHWFLEDPRKDGGSRNCTRGRVKKLNQTLGFLTLEGGMEIPFSRIRSIVFPDAK